MNYKLNRLSFENFKLFKNRVFDFKASDLIILDGPNGFGKTTIFDALELVFTKKVSRIRNLAHGTAGATDFLWLNKQDSPSRICAEFKSDSDLLVISVELDPSKVRKSERQADNWDMFHRYQLDSFDSKTVLKELDQKQINDRFNFPNLKGNYKRLFYVQQQESLHFLKTSEKDKTSALSAFLGTEEAEEEKKNIGTKLKIVSGGVNNLTDIIKELKTNKAKLMQMDAAPSFIDLELDRAWDAADFTFKSEEQEQILVDLSKITDLKTHFSHFKNYSLAARCQRLQDKPELFLDTLFLHNQLPIEDLTKIQKTQKFAQSQLKALTKEHVLAAPEKVKILELLEGFAPDLDATLWQIRWKELADGNKELSQLDSILNELDQARRETQNSFDALAKSRNEEITDCPLCGHPWETLDKLKNQFIIQHKNLSSFQSEKSKKIEQQVDQILLDLKPLFDGIDNYLKENDYEEAFWKRLELVQSTMQHRIVLLHFIEEQGKQEWLTQFAATPKKNFDDETQVSIAFKAKLESIKPPYDPALDYEPLKTTFKDVFADDPAKVELLTLDGLTAKEQYLNWQFSLAADSLIEKEQKDLISLKAIETKIKALVEKYKNKIEGQQTAAANSIGIPFYLYSGKILQNYQNGLGAQLRISKNSKAPMKLVSKFESDQDILNSMSSGQLSGIVMALTLSLNQAFCSDSNLGMLMIDDPLQTMDDINLASLIELLRSGFKGKQLILSTHEDHLSQLIQYRFKQYGYEPAVVNLMQEDKKSLEAG